MKKYLLFFLLVVFVAGCSRVSKEKEILAKVNNYEITRQEFEEEFAQSSSGMTDTVESRKEFLENLINRKLILQDAQRQDLDKDKAFLKMIEKFWEQSLLKLCLDKKSKEIAGSNFVNDKAVEEAYQKMFKEGKTDKTYDQMYQQIRWEITKLKESQMMSDWIGDLRKRAQIQVNYDLLKRDK